MLARTLRDVGYTAVGPRAGTMLEKQLTGANAVTRRALMGYRAAMARLFRAAKSNTQ